VKHVKIKLAAGGLIIVFLAFFLYLQNNWIVLTRLDSASEHLPDRFDGFRIVQISDLHSKWFGREQERLVKVISKAAPDIIVLTGDLVDGRHYDENAALALVKKAAEIAPVYYVTGNHEWWSGKFPELEGKIKAAGAAVLQGDARELSLGGERIYIAGIDDPESAGNYEYEASYMEKKLHATIPQMPSDNYRILLSHRPEAFYQYSSYGVDLVFSGHAHGGQFRLPFIGGLYAPDQGYFPKFTSGIYRDGRTSMVVSRGLGNSVIPLRLFNRPEVVLVTLHTSSGDASGSTSGASGGVDSGKNEAGTARDKAAAGNAPAEGEAGLAAKASAEPEPYLIREEGETVQERILAPDGFQRVRQAKGSFGEYLRNLPLKPHGAEVLYYNGNAKPAKVYEAVLDMDVGTRDLQQCADSIIRLRAEYLYGMKRYDGIVFHFTNGFRADYATWSKGNRIRVSGNKAYWVSQGDASFDYDSFRKYLDMVFAYAGTLSLSKELKAVDVEEIQPGDVFIQGDTPGHAEIVLDVAVHKETGEKRFLLAQGYMPAQEMHILKNPGEGAGNPWYSIGFGDTLDTPEWDFSRDQLMRFEN
jgi:predicted MPP superfamily phosphohydrolase